MKYYPFYAGGQFREGADLLEVVNPYTGQVFASTWRATPEDLEYAVTAALAVAEEMKQLPSYQRYEILQEITAGLEDNMAEIAEILCLESGKPLKHARGEVLRAIQVFRISAEEARRLPKEYMALDWTASGTRKEGLVKYFPVGLVAAISPFNFPLNLAAHKVGPAIAAGCPVILKPASATPLTALLLAGLVHQTALPKGGFSVLPLDRQSGNIMVTDERFKLLTFTGSPEVGWDMKRQAGKKRVVLELGGNAGLIVTQTANVEEAARKAVFGAFSYSGQVCIHTQRIYVHEQVFDLFAECFKTFTSQLHEGDPLDSDTDISVMIDEANAIRVEQWVNEAVANGARVMCGGKRSGSYYEPTVLIHTRPDMKVCAMEIFGPVVTLEKYSSFQETIERVNNSRYGLQAGVFTDNLTEAEMAFDHLEVGGVILNEVPTFRLDHMPYGGIKDSGLGREGIKYAIYDMLEPKILVK